MGIDPPSSHANILADGAWARAHGTSTFTMPESTTMPGVEKSNSILGAAPQPLPVQITPPPPAGYVCGNCTNFDDKKAFCNFHKVLVRPVDVACTFQVARKK